MKHNTMRLITFMVLFSVVIGNLAMPATVPVMAQSSNQESPAPLTPPIIPNSAVSKGLTDADTFIDCAMVTEIPQSECEALAAFYTSSGGSNWSNHAGWLETYRPCSWFGVACSSGYVTDLYLQDNHLSGSIPPEIGALTGLRFLNLNVNALSGSIPPEIGNLTQLQELGLDENQLSGSIPPEIGNLTGLTSLGLEVNQLSGSIPPELGNLENLNLLSLRSNQLSGSIPPELANLYRLRFLHLDHNQLSGSIPVELSNLTRLEQLKLSNNLLSGSLPVSLENLTYMTVFSFNNTDLCEPDEAAFQSWLSGIQYLDRTHSCSSTITPEPTGTPTPTPESAETDTPTPTNTATEENTLEPSSTVTPTRTYTSTNTATSTYTPTNTPTQTFTFTPTPTRTYTPTNTYTSTNTPTKTPTQTYTPTNTYTSTYTPTNTPTKTFTFTPTPTKTYTPTNTYTNTPTRTPIPTQIPYPEAFNKNAPEDMTTGVMDSLTLSWESSSNAEGYEYCYSTDVYCPGDWTSAGTSLSANLNDLERGTTYYWQVRAHNATGTIDANNGMWWIFFTQENCYPLTLNHTGSGADPAADPIKSPDCATDYTYVAGESISLTASPADGNRVESWTDADNESSETSIVLSMPASARTVTVNYTPYCYTLYTYISPYASGTISADPGPNCSGDMQYTYGTSVTLTANPAVDYLFANWGEDVEGTANPISIIMTSDRSVSANFTFNGILPAEGSTASVTRPTLGWPDTAGATAYTVQVSTSPNFGSYIVYKTVTDSTYTLTTDLPRNKWIYWRTLPNGVSPAAWSAVHSFYSANPPGVPTLSSPANGSLLTTYAPRLDWSNSSVPDGTTFFGYWLQIATDSSFASLVRDDILPGLTNSEKTLTETPLDPNLTFFWHVCAMNSLGHNSEWSATRSFRTPMLPPELVEPANFDQVKTTRPTFTWNTVYQATSYHIQVSASPAFNSSLVNATVSSTAYTHTSDLPRDQILYWRVRANGANQSNWSAVFSFTSADPPAIPSLLAPSNGATLSTYTPTLDWNDPAGADHYDVQIASANTFADGTIVDENTSVTSSSYNPSTPLAANRTFYWRVLVYDAAGQYSNWSAVRHFHTSLPAPGLVAPANQASGVVLRPVFDWTDVSEATGYEIQVSSSPTFGVLVLHETVTASIYTATTNLKSGKRYYWRVQTKGTYTSAWSEVGYFDTQ
jgi:hypothetical protein